MPKSRVDAFKFAGHDFTLVPQRGFFVVEKIGNRKARLLQQEPQVRPGWNERGGLVSR